jgi:hypothetical protein
VNAFLTNPFYETLWTQHLLPYLALASYVTSLPSISMQTGSNGLFYNNTEFSQNAGADGMKLMQDTMMQNLDDAKVCMINFLCTNKACTNKADYPLFCSECCPDECGPELEGRDLGIIFY